MQRDLFLLVRAACTAVTRFISPIAAIGCLCVSSVAAGSTNQGTDYLLPAEANGGFVVAPSRLESAQPKSKTTATSSYRAFNGNTYQLVENRGRFVNVLIPQAYDAGPFFTTDHIEELVDRLDMLYVLYAELMQEEPSGDGLLNVAFVPQTCGRGCGLVGAKGFEILSDPSNYEPIIRELDAGRLEPVLLHEMSHNFDTLSAYLHYLPDHAHAWTDIFEFFAPYRFSRVGSYGEAPDDRYNSPVSMVWKEYVTREDTNWQRCVVDQDCGAMGLPANALWAMLYYRIEAMHGIGALLGSFDFLREYARQYPPPATNLQKEGLRILSLAAGAGTNIACYMDAFKWPIPAKVMTELQNRFATSSEFCSDLDQDGFSAINGDCDDRDPSRNITMAETRGDAVDNDCDDLVDEAHLLEPGSGGGDYGSLEPVEVSIPFEVEGSSSRPDDRDSFVFALPVSSRIRVTLCTQGDYGGWVAAINADGSFLQAANWYSYHSGPGCVSNTFDFAGLDNAGLSVIADDSVGDYSLTVSEANDLLPDHSAFLQSSPGPSGGTHLQITDQHGLFASLGTDEIELWISGAGQQVFMPFAPSQTVELNDFTVPGLRDGAIYQARVRPRGRGLPLAAFSAGHAFKYQSSPAAPAPVDHRFSGAWFDEAHDGEGFIIQVLENNRAVVYWFTYRDDGSQRWMVGAGNVDGNRIRVSRLVDSRGGRFGADFDPGGVVRENVGSLSINFQDCSTALVNYSVDDNGAHQATARLTSVYGHGCDGLTPAPDKDLSGSWYDPAHDGEGFIIEQISADTALVFWFTYDETGKQSWFYDTGTINGGQVHLSRLVQPMGGRFGRSFDPAKVMRHEWGELILDLNCDGGTASYTTQTQGYSSGSQSLVRLTALANSSCLQ